MNTKRLALALERLDSGDWARFERFASQFLTQDYPSLRTVANPAGDLGRDSELFSPTGEASVLLQYSVTKNWAAKIRETAIRIRENFKDTPILIYVTNQQIGAKADTIKKSIRNEFKLVVDIHDSSWFIDRVENGARTEIAEKLAIDILDPYLAGRGVVENNATALNSYEAKAAVLHLQLQWEDNSREKGLTKISFDALVKSALRETTSSNRSTIQTVKDTVCRLLPAHPKDIIEREVNSALDRLDKTAIRRWHQLDEVCLTHDEVIKVRSSLEQKEIKKNALEAEIRKTLRDYFDTPIDEKSETALCVRVRRVLDTFLLNKGEEFATAV